MLRERPRASASRSRSRSHNSGQIGTDPWHSCGTHPTLCGTRQFMWAVRSAASKSFPPRGFLPRVYPMKHGVGALGGTELCRQDLSKKRGIDMKSLACVVLGIGLAVPTVATVAAAA